jgi:hypothetical protein
LELIGEDIFTKKEECIWEMNIGVGVASLQEKLCPPDLPVGGRTAEGFSECNNY